MARGRPSLEDDQETLLARVPADGTSIGNTALRTDLEWTEERYYRARNLLVDAGQLLLGRGRGGSVKRVILEPTAPREVPEAPLEQQEAAEPAPYAEDALYDPIVRVLRSEFVQEQRLQQAWFEITARQGRRSTGGKWTRPDIAGASVRRFKYLTGIHLDVWTFEVKPKGACDVSGVFEAAAHSRAATRSCVLFHQPDFEEDERVRVVHEAQRLGIGLIEFNDPANYDTWEIIVPPVRRQPEPEAVEEFIEVQLSQEIKDNILRARG
jgi:hypothetical protein